MSHDVGCIGNERGRWGFFSIPPYRGQWKAESFMKVHRVPVVTHLLRCSEGGNGEAERRRERARERGDRRKREGSAHQSRPLLRHLRYRELFPLFSDSSKFGSKSPEGWEGRREACNNFSFSHLKRITKKNSLGGSAKLQSVLVYEFNIYKI